jgi:Fic family protein
MPAYQIPQLPLSFDVETKEVMKKTTLARSTLAEMKGIASSIPNERILISTLPLQEAKDSSEIENIITTHDDIFKSDYRNKKFPSIASKEVHNYAEALLSGFNDVKGKKLLTVNQILRVQSLLEENRAGFRKLQGTELKNSHTGNVVYTPPQSYDEVVSYMDNLERFINDNSISGLDPLVKMAIIHHQFESIHPFYDANGRTGRIINLLYLVKEGLLDTPILYFSRYVNRNKGKYYELLQKVRDENLWEEWILFILDGVEDTSQDTIRIIQGIKRIMLSHKNTIRSKLPKIYSQDLLNNIFKHPYTKIEFVVQDLDVTRDTASRYLNELMRIGLLDKMKIGKEVYYINTELFELFKNVSNNTLEARL